MEYEEYFDAWDTGSRGGIPFRVFIGSLYHGHGIGSVFSACYLEKYFI